MKLAFPPGMKVGYEMEFCLPKVLDTSTGYYYSSGALLNQIAPWFEIGSDGSLSPKRGISHLVELRSRVLTEVDIDKVKLTLEFLKTKNVFITRTCGFHLHWSWDPMNALTLAGRLAPKLSQFKPWEERSEYCSWSSNRREAKYRPLRVVEDGHYEIRIFNGSLNLRALLRYFLFLHNEAELVARGSQAPQIQSVESVGRVI